LKYSDIYYTSLTYYAVHDTHAEQAANNSRS